MNIATKKPFNKLLIQKHYIIFSIISTLVMVVPISLYLKFGSADLKEGLIGITIMIVRVLIAICIIFLIKLFLPDGSLVIGRNYREFKGIIFGLPYLLLSLLTTIVSNLGVDLSSINTPSPQILVVFFINMFLIGFNEEFLFRGLILNNLYIAFGKTSYGLKKAVILSSVFFGLMHIANIFVAPYQTTLIQMIMAIFGGILFCGIYLKSQNIWVAVIIHTLLDVIAFILSALGVGSVLNVEYKWYEGLIIMVIGSAIQLIYGALLLKNIKTND